MYTTGKTAYFTYAGRRLRFLNQRCKEWTHPYEYIPNGGETLSSSGCGIFSACFAAQVMSGKEIDPHALADFSCQNGGRGDDGTDRPKLLEALQKSGLAKEYGFEYRFDGLMNAPEQLWAVMQEGGCCLCNLRVGHIVALIDKRVVNGERQVLAMDPYSESGDARVREHVREVVKGTEVTAPVYGKDRLITGYQLNYALFWVPLTLPRDVNYLHKI